MSHQPEIKIINDRVNSLEASVLRSVNASESVSKCVNELLLEFKERDVRHEFEKDANKELAETVKNLTATVDGYINLNAATLVRCKKTQDRWDNFFTSLTTNAGKIFVAVMLFGVMILLGLNPKDLFTK